MSRFFPTPAECGHHTIFGSTPIRTFAGDHVQLSLVDVPPGGVRHRVVAVDGPAQALDVFYPIREEYK